MSSEPRRFPLPKPLWFFLTTITLIVLAAGFRIVLPIYRQQRAIHEIESVGGNVFTSSAGPHLVPYR